MINRQDAAAAAGEAIARTDAESREGLTPEQFLILREGMTEPPFTGEYWQTTVPGLYVCAACDAPLYASEQQVDAGTGWPCFTAPVTATAVARRLDRSAAVVREELVCRRCHGHLGHVGVNPAALAAEHHHVNSAALRLCPRK